MWTYVAPISRRLACSSLSAAQARISILPVALAARAEHRYVCATASCVTGPTGQYCSNHINSCHLHVLDQFSSACVAKAGTSSSWHTLISSCSFTTGRSCQASEPTVVSSSSSSSNTVADASTASTTSGSSSRKTSESNAESLQVPPAVAAGAAAAGAAATKAAKSVAKQASRLVKLVQSTSLSEATWLQLSSTWQSHSATITAVTAAAATAGVYHLLAAAAGNVVDLSDPMAQWACVTASAAAVAAAGLQIRSSFTVDAERVYRIAMRKLNRHAGLQEVMGSPLAGSDVRLELVTQGTLFVQETLLPKRRAPRIHLLFQLNGPTKSGVVSVEAKKAFGSKYAFKTLMVELPDKTLTSQAAAAAAAATATKLHSAAAVQAHARPSSPSQPVIESRPSSSEQPAGNTQAGPSKGQEPARIYIIGQPASTTTSSSSSMRHLSPSVLLEDLKEPLLYALKHNLPGYEAEDETEGALAWSKPQVDPDQTTWWDDTKKGTKLLACRAYAAARAGGAAAAAAVQTAGSKLKAQAAAGNRRPASSTAGLSSSSIATAEGSRSSGSPSSNVEPGADASSSPPTATPAQGSKA